MRAATASPFDAMRVGAHAWHSPLAGETVLSVDLLDPEPHQKGGHVAISWTKSQHEADSPLAGTAVADQMANLIAKNLGLPAPTERDVQRISERLREAADLEMGSK